MGAAFQPRSCNLNGLNYGQRTPPSAAQDVRMFEQKINNLIGQRMPRAIGGQKGYTLIEIVMVIVILGLLILSIGLLNIATYPIQ